MTNAIIKPIIKTFTEMKNNAQLEQTKHIIALGEVLLAALNPANKADLEKIYKIVLGVITIFNTLKLTGKIKLEGLEQIVPPFTSESTFTEMMSMEDIRLEQLIYAVADRILKKDVSSIAKDYVFNYEKLSQEFPHLLPILEEINYQLNPELFRAEYDKLTKKFEESIQTFQKAGYKTSEAQAQFVKSLTELKNMVLFRCQQRAPLYTLANSTDIANNVKTLINKIAATNPTPNDIKIFKEAMAPFSNNSEQFAVLLKTLLIAASALLAGLVVAGIPGMVVGGTVGTVSACIYAQWAAPETLPTDVIADAATALFK